MRLHTPGALVVLLLLACTATDKGDPVPTDSAADTGDTADTGAPAGPDRVAVSGYFSGDVLLLDRATGEAVGHLYDVPGAQTLAVAPDGTWLIVAELENEIRRYDPATLALLEVVTADDPATKEDESGGLVAPTAALVGPDGLLYVTSFEQDRVLRFDDGGYVDDFVPPGAGGLDGPDIGLAFAPDGTLWVPGWYSDTIHRYAADGTPLDPALGPDDGIDRPRGIAFAADGTAWITTEGDGHLGRVDPDGTYTEVASVRGATGIALEPEGTILVGAGTAGTVRRYGPDGEELATLGDTTLMDGVTALTLLSG